MILRVLRAEKPHGKAGGKGLTRNLSLASLVLAALLYACSHSYASETLTISLETPDQTAPTDAAKASAPGVPALSAAPGAKPAQSTETTANDAQTVKVGRVAVVQVPTAGIYRTKSSAGSKYATVKAETPLAVVREEGDWYGVLMVNNEVGWIARDCVKMTGYELVTSRKDLARGQTTSRGGQLTRADLPETAIIKTAMQYSGVRYVYGGTDPATGMDCSAFVRMVFAQHGVTLPRTAREQALVGQSVPIDQLQPGDRLYFSCKNSYIDHCGIYAGNGYFVHSSRSKNGVGIDSLASDFYWRSLVIARR